MSFGVPFVAYDTPSAGTEGDGWARVAEAVRRFARRRTRSADLAEDIAQETVVRLMDYARREKIVSIYALAFRIAENLIAEQHRRHRRQPVAELNDEIASPEPSPERVLEGREAVRILQAALARMPRLRREVIVRRRVLNQSCETIALELDLSLKAVEKHVTRGLMDLKKAACARWRPRWAGSPRRCAPASWSRSGDNFYDDGVASVDDPKWRTSFEVVYDAPGLQVPWYVALGNHDYHGSPQAQIDYTLRSPRWRMPARWYGRREQAPDGATIEIFVLDTLPFIAAYVAGAENLRLEGQDPAAQLAWLDRALAASTAQWKIVVGHHPIWAGGPHGGMPELQAALAPRLARHGVQLYLNGHNHDLQHVARDGAHFVCTGAGSKMDPSCEIDGSDFCSVSPGFVAVSVSRREMRLDYRDLTGATLKVVDIAAAPARA